MTITTQLRRFTATAAVLYAIVLVLIAFWPIPVDRPAARSLGRLIVWLAEHGLGWITYARVETGANVLLFIPAGLLLVVLLGVPRWWLGVICGVAASAVIEVGQHLFLHERFATIDDVFANTLGTVIGTLFGILILLVATRADHFRHRHDRAEHRARRPAEPGPGGGPDPIS